MNNIVNSDGRKALEPPEGPRQWRLTRVYWQLEDAREQENRCAEALEEAQAYRKDLEVLLGWLLSGENA